MINTTAKPFWGLAKNMVTDCHDRNYTYKDFGRILQMDDFVKLFIGFYK